MRSIDFLFPVSQREAEDGVADSKKGEAEETERAAVAPDFIKETAGEAELTQLESLYINTVCVEEKERRAEKGCLRVTVEITHPALHLPVYRTWTGTWHVANTSIIIIHHNHNSQDNLLEFRATVISRLINYPFIFKESKNGPC